MTQQRFSSDLAFFGLSLAAMPTVVHALATGVLLPLEDREIHSLFTSCVEMIDEDPAPYTATYGAYVQDEAFGALHLDPEIFEQAYALDLVKALQAGQFARRLEAGHFIDLSRMSEQDLATLFNRQRH